MSWTWQAPALAPAATGTDVLLRTSGELGHITLNRPKAINALTLEMVRQLHACLDALEADDSVAVVLIDGAGERGLCAGGDIVALHRSAKEGTAEAVTFWAEEYAMNLRISGFPKPIVAIMDGIVMGGGIGIAGHASHRVATETLTAAMPEVGIGFTPDVGGTWLLANAPGELGTHVALTAGRAGAQDAVTLGLADVILARAAIPALAERLRAGEFDAALTEAEQVPLPADLRAGTLAGDRSWIDAAYAGEDAEQILATLQARPEPAAAKAASAMQAASPTSVKVTLQALRRAARLPDLEAALQQELRVSTGFLGCADFVEGVRAQVIDKDRNPAWDPPTLAQVDQATVDAFFVVAAGAADRS